MDIIKKIPLNPHKDERGFSWFPFQDFPQIEGKPLLNFHVAELKPGTTRGDHYHPYHTEYFLLCGSQFRLFAEDFHSNQEEEVFAVSPDFLFIIPPNIKHTIQNIGSGTNFYAGFFEGEGEVKTIK